MMLLMIVVVVAVVVAADAAAAPAAAPAPAAADPAATVALAVPVSPLVPTGTCSFMIVSVIGWSFSVHIDAPSAEVLTE